MKKFLILTLILISIVSVKNSYASSRWDIPFGSTEREDGKWVTSGNDVYDPDTCTWNDEGSSH